MHTRTHQQRQNRRQEAPDVGRVWYDVQHDVYNCLHGQEPRRRARVVRRPPRDGDHAHDGGGDGGVHNCVREQRRTASNKGLVRQSLQVTRAAIEDAATDVALATIPNTRLTRSPRSPPTAPTQAHTCRHHTRTPHATRKRKRNSLLQASPTTTRTETETRRRRRRR
jgi:hypothetical protein